MSNALQKTQAQTISDMPELVTPEQAEEAMMLAEMGQDDLVKKVTARTTIGRFLTQSKGSHIVADIEMTRGMLEAVMNQVAKDIVDGKGTAASRAAAADTFAKLANARATQNALSLKTQEVVAVGTQKGRQQGRAPGAILGMTINTAKVEITEAPKPS